WAIEHPHDHFLLYGTPVPGYIAPQDTVVSGTRVTLALAAIVRDASDAGRLGAVHDDGSGALVPPLRDELADLMTSIALTATVESALAFISAWSQMFGLIAFELTNQTRGVVEHHEALFLATVRSTARRIGLR
ncbi:MAG: TetR-like C-terminal domain-containing protein, partial [Ilumatobacteraceae bacterium]